MNVSRDSKKPSVANDERIFRPSRQRDSPITLDEKRFGDDEMENWLVCGLCKFGGGFAVSGVHGLLQHDHLNQDGAKSFEEKSGSYR